MPPSTYWRIAVSVPAAARDAFEAALDPFAEAISAVEEEARGVWHIEALSAGAPDRRRLDAALAAAAAKAGIAVPALAVDPLPEIDWLAENRRQFPPVEAGRYFVYGSLYDGPVPAGRVAIRLDASIAFGAGGHETTRGCLLVLDRLAAAGRAPARALDLGCGSGILAIAIARTWRIPVLAADIDPAAVGLARENAAANGVGDLVEAVTSDGLAAAEIARGAPYDLVVANILAEPLIALAGGLSDSLAADGRLVLSGLLTRQEEAVVAACARAGLAVVDRVRLGDWPTLVLGRPAAGA